MSGQYASLHAGLLVRERPPSRPVEQPVVGLPPLAVRPFPMIKARAEPAARKAHRRSFTVRLDDAQYLLLQVAKARFGLSGQRLLVLALERLLGTGGR